MKTIEGNVTALDAKLDLILDKFKSTHVKEVESEEDVVGEWSKDIEEAWNEVKPRGVGQRTSRRSRARSRGRGPSRPPRRRHLRIKKKVTQSTLSVKGLLRRIINSEDLLKLFTYV